VCVNHASDLSTPDEHDECLIIVPADKHDIYFERLYYHFANGNMDVVYSNRQMQYESYRMKIIALLKNNKRLSSGTLIRHSSCSSCIVSR
jgi:hypothetical protein